MRETSKDHTARKSFFSFSIDGDTESFFNFFFLLYNDNYNNKVIRFFFSKKSKKKKIEKDGEKK